VYVLVDAVSHMDEASVAAPRARLRAAEPPVFTELGLTGGRGATRETRGQDRLGESGSMAFEPTSKMMRSPQAMAVLS
jgi:hypothetical protein